MKKIIGIIIMMFAIVFASTTFSLTIEIKKINSLLHEKGECPIAPKICPMFKTPNAAIISYLFSGFLFLLGLFMILEKEAFRQKRKKIVGLDKDEKKIYQLILDADGTIFQSELVEKSGFGKVKVTRVLDKLEGKQIIERRRRGMTNVVILK